MSTSPDGGAPERRLVALAVDDEVPALTELRYLLEHDPRIERVHTAGNGTDALAVLEAERIDVVFSDINMPGLDGLRLARILARFAHPPRVVFVTAHDAHAVDAFALDADDYVMKPVRRERLAEAIRRVQAALNPASAPADADPTTGGYRGNPALVTTPPGSPVSAATPSSAAPAAVPDETIPVELGGVTRFINRSDIRFVQAHGDYARLHTATGSHLVRVPLATLEERWAAAGFVRIHRSTLVSTPHISEVRMEHGRCTVVVEGKDLQVSRRHTRALRERMLQGPAGRRTEP